MLELNFDELVVLLQILENTKVEAGSNAECLVVLRTELHDALKNEGIDPYVVMQCNGFNLKGMVTVT